MKEFVMSPNCPLYNDIKLGKHEDVQVRSKANRAIIARLGYIVQIWLYQYDPIGKWKFKISKYEIECSCFWKVDSYVSIINYHDFVKC